MTDWTATIPAAGNLVRPGNGGQHWKILLPSGMGFFTDAYDLFIIGVVATMITSEWHIASYQNCSCRRWRC